NVTREETARNIVREATRFTVERAKAIPQSLINSFIDAWKHIFNVTTIQGGNDSSELYRNCVENKDSALNRLRETYEALPSRLIAMPFATAISDACALLNKWSRIRDHKEFFETIIDARESAAALFDKCKSINAFATEQFARYEVILGFINENEENFDFLSPEQQSIVEQLKAIETDMEPWKNIPAYNKMMRSLKGELDKCRQGLVEQITSTYNRIFDDLDKYAREVNVSSDKYARRDATISSKTGSKNFYVLKANVETKSFYEEQVNRINKAVNVVPEPSPDHSVGSEAKPVKTPVVRIRKVVTLNTRTTEPMRTEADVDLYLQGLKAEIMQYIGEDNDIIIG
ncbi:MAG: hypothetical protein LUC24_03245, partial [Bacteroidales bacterium]|nr:hypothetical protein [Bacteroidales bacterium]